MSKSRVNGCHPAGFEQKEPAGHRTALCALGIDISTTMRVKTAKTATHPDCSDKRRLLSNYHDNRSMFLQALVESGVDGKESEGESKDKYESHTQVSDLTIIFADTRMILVKRTQAS